MTLYDVSVVFGTMCAGHQSRSLLALSTHDVAQGVRAAKLQYSTQSVAVLNEREISHAQMLMSCSGRVPRAYRKHGPKKPPVFREKQLQLRGVPLHLRCRARVCRATPELVRSVRGFSAHAISALVYLAWSCKRTEHCPRGGAGAC